MSIDTPLLSVVIPAFNEVDVITKSLLAVNDFLSSQEYPWEVIVSDDGSTDNTIAEVERFIAGHLGFRLLKNEHRGKSNAVRAGIFEASGDYILVTDADLAVPINEIKRFLLWVHEQGSDLVFASREGKGAKRVGEPYYRHFIGRVFNILIQIILLPRIFDTQCGFRLFKRSAAQKIFSKLLIYGKDMPILAKPFFGAFEVETLYLARKMKLKIKELPVIWTYSPTKRLNFFGNSSKMLRDVIKIRWYGLLGKYKV